MVFPMLTRGGLYRHYVEKVEHETGKRVDPKERETNIVCQCPARSNGASIGKCRDTYAVNASTRTVNDVLTHIYDTIIIQMSCPKT
eukprot:1961036-Amphidinium_carterae.1